MEVGIVPQESQIESPWTCPRYFSLILGLGFRITEREGGREREKKRCISKRKRVVVREVVKEREREKMRKLRVRIREKKP
jgi:hypothetical protein